MKKTVSLWNQSCSHWGNVPADALTMALKEQLQIIPDGSIYLLEEFLDAQLMDLETRTFTNGVGDRAMDGRPGYSQTWTEMEILDGYHGEHGGTYTFYASETAEIAGLLNGLSGEKEIVSNVVGGTVSFSVDVTSLLVTPRTVVVRVQGHRYEVRLFTVTMKASVTIS